ncbi:MAG: hypothetical protein AAF371_13505 [Pseudomonadota bacterium]
MKKMTLIASALAAGLAAAPAVADPVVPLPVQQADASFSFRFGVPGVIVDDRRYYKDRHYDDRYYGGRSYDRGYYDRGYHDKRAYRRALREERIERRLEGRFVGYRPREIRYNLRDMGFRRIDIVPAGRGYRVAALRNGNEFAFRIGGRSGRIRRAERF